MCGIVGFLGRPYSDNSKDLAAMLAAIEHRGPDSEGSYECSEDNFLVNFGHTRLSIIDTSTKANQPMKSICGRYVLVYNGEIYNFEEIRSEITAKYPGHIWTSNSDTEVLLTAVALFGLDIALEKVAGMFAFALWDNKREQLTLVRDRIGEKPLYYGYQNQYLLFGSELGAIERHSCFERKLNERAAVLYLKNGVVSGEQSIYKNIYKVPPGAILEFSKSQILDQILPSKRFYWKLSNVIKSCQENPYLGSYEEAISDFEKLLVKVIKEQSVSDVPIGAFLSGGIDSSVVCSIMKVHAKNDLRTFSIGMPPPGEDEAVFAQSVAEHIKSTHAERYLSIEEIKERIDEIIGFWDEPFADSSQIPTFFVAELAREFVTVSISGDGADEFLVGYSHYSLYRKLKAWTFIKYLPIQAIFSLITAIYPKFKASHFYKRLNSISQAVRLENESELNAFWKDKFRGYDLPVRKELIDEEVVSVNSESFSYAGYHDAITYLPDDILVKVDRATMAVSLESRSPFLDHRIIEFLVNLPMEYKYNKGVSKRILKDVLYKYVPEKMVNRPKQGFAIPISKWLRKELFGWADNIISNIDPSSSLWEKSKVEDLWKSHLQGSRDHGERLWSIIVLESFLKRKF